MSADQNDDMPVCCADKERASRFAAEAMALLPTLQRNALRKIFDRHDFSPAEVAALGYKRLQLAEGIGGKGLQAIASWLQKHGYALAPPPPVPPSSQVTKRVRQTIEQARRLLRAHGYEVTPRGKTAGRQGSGH